MSQTTSVALQETTCCRNTISKIYTYIYIFDYVTTAKTPETIRHGDFEHYRWEVRKKKGGKRGGEKDRKYDYVISSETIRHGDFEHYRWEERKKREKKRQEI